MAQVNLPIDPKEELLWRADAAARQAELVPPEERQPWITMEQRCRDLALRIQAQERRASAH